MSLELPRFPILCGISRLAITILATSLLLVVGAPPSASAQLGELISPGPLSRAHANLEGIDNCAKCHEKGQRVSADRCLACHKPIAERISQHKGVHRKVEGECEMCHVEHAGRDGELRPFDQSSFDHAVETGLALDGKHASIATQCEKCHKTRSFLSVQTDCASCHEDPHKGKLGTDCAKCHSSSVDFKQAGTHFDHSKAAFPLEGAHRTVSCQKCHVNQVYKGVKFESCTDCHESPHRTAVGNDCRSCHTPKEWRVQAFDHSRTGTSLRGRHANVACEKCHVKPATQIPLKMTPCSTCHEDPHRGRFKQDCAACHNESGFKGAPFDHASKTKFALEGKHASIQCSSCHKKTSRGQTVDFSDLKSECSACHQDPHRGSLGTTCESCHGTTSFELSAFQHPRFPELFSGEHEKVACEKCHRTGAVPTTDAKAPPVATRIYRGLSTDCRSCHEDVHLGQLPDCTNCHSVNAARFAPSLFHHEKTAYPLTGKHQAVDCVKCHRKESGRFPAGSGTAVRFKNLPTDCASCHSDVHLGQLEKKCETCHTTASFEVKKYAHKTRNEFFRGRHATADCSACHKKVEGDFPSGHGTTIRFTGMADSCASCHTDPHSGQLGQTCESCHTIDSAWKNASRAFHKAGIFPLEGRHLATPCADCHWNGVVKGTPNDCYDCHWIRRQDDKYRTRLGNQCETCHRPTSWAPIAWNHGARTGFELTQVHRNLPCESCHVDAVFAGTPTGCVGCHLGDYQRAGNPNHVSAGFPTTCEACHFPSDTSWNQAHFNHTTFPLAGIHTTQPCDACHINQIYTGTPRECVDCHRAVYDQATNPNHAAAGFGTTCEDCHQFSHSSWNQGVYPHNLWPLEGVHLNASCSTCHTSTIYSGLPSECVACHRTRYDEAVEPNHVAAGFPMSCEVCHRITDSTWQLGRFDHSGFMLAGTHATQTCNACHVNDVYQGTPTTCAGCHQTQYDQAQQPNHVAAGFPTTCDSCHRFSDSSWDQGVYDHVTFQLAGNHAVQTCNACHRDNVFAGTPRECVGCHQTDFTNAQNPSHVAAGFPTDCELCHGYTDSGWDQGRLDHTIFPLAGSHLNQPCTSCHENGIYVGTPRECVSCHLADYNLSVEPNHAASGFPLTCEDCHRFSDTTWDQGEFDHSIFPLAGTHATEPCTSCHQNGVYAGTPRECVSCHLADYNLSVDPNHAASGFPMTCEDCHRFSDTTWDQGEFDHSIFPLAGIHATEPCVSCHQNGVFAGTPRDCAGCHLPEYNQTTDPNHAASGFPTSCENCHKFTDTSWDQGEFDHASFPLAGQHASADCNSCHRNGVYAGTSRECVDCHLAEYQATNDPDHAAAGFPPTCEACHRFSDSSWSQGQFDHIWFPITSGKHSGFTCADCHTSPSNYQVFTCLTCHRRGETDGHHSEVFGYQYDSQACYLCHPQGRSEGGGD